MLRNVSCKAEIEPPGPAVEELSCPVPEPLGYSTTARSSGGEAAVSDTAMRLRSHAVRSKERGKCEGVTE